jgi:hypothetical protein
MFWIVLIIVIVLISLILISVFAFSRRCTSQALDQAAVNAKKTNRAAAEAFIQKESVRQQMSGRRQSIAAAQYEAMRVKLNNRPS